jgi:Ca2+:H+ antiporter
MSYLKLLGYLCIPLAYAVHYLAHDAGWEPIATFVLAAIAILPLAALMGEATEHLAARAGPTWGGLLNATFGNAAELIIATIALSKGTAQMNEVVKASLTGSILGNILLVAGVAMLVGGWRRKEQSFNPFAAEANAGMLAIGVAAMLTPAIFHHVAESLHDPQRTLHEHGVSVGCSIILLVTYALGLLFTLRTHSHIYSRPSKEGVNFEVEGHAGVEHWSVRRSFIMLLVASAGVGLVAELLVASAATVAQHLGWNSVFVGVILLAIIGNAAEHSTAILMARNDDMDTAMTITYQSSLQIALFVVPFVIFASMFMHAVGWTSGPKMDLVFTPLEVVAVILAVGIVTILGMNGRTNWFEGVLLLALYAILGIAFFFIPGSQAATSAPAPGH